MCKFCDVDLGERKEVSNVAVELKAGERVVEVHDLNVHVLNWDGDNYYICAGYGSRTAADDRVAVEIPINFCPICGRKLAIND